MIRATNMAAAFFNASLRDAAEANWVARCVKDRARHTTVGVKRENDFKVNVSGKTRRRLAIVERVIV